MLPKREIVRERLERAGCSPGVIDEILPLLPKNGSVSDFVASLRRLRPRASEEALREYTDAVLGYILKEEDEGEEQIAQAA